MNDLTEFNEFEGIKNIDENGNEYGLERELQHVIEYTEWRDFEKLSCYACYLISQIGDSRKKVIATTKIYFDVQTRNAA